MEINELEPDEPLVFGFIVGADGAVRALDWAGIIEARPDPATGRVWLHFDRTSAEARRWLETHENLDPLVLDNLFQDESRPRAVRHAGGLLINLRGVNLNPDSDPEDMIALRIWATEQLLVTTRRLRIRAVLDVKTDYESGAPPPSHAAVVARLAARLSDRMSPVVAKIDEDMDALEDDMLDESTPPPKAQLAAFRRAVLRMRRYISPQRDALNTLIREDQAFAERDRLVLRETHDTVTRIAEDLDTIRERALVMQEQIAELQAEAMNQRLFVLAILSAVFLPLGFLTGLFGVNVGGMPGVGSPIAFAALCGGLVLLTLGLFLVFRRMRWL